MSGNEGFSVKEFGLVIRPARLDEMEAILEVYRQCEDFLAICPVPVASMQMVQADLELSKSLNGVFCGIYTSAGKMIGVLDYVPCGYHGDAGAAYLNLLMIAAPWRSQGIGHAVVEALGAQLRRNPQVTVLLAGVQENNYGAVRFWQREGFRITAGPLKLQDGTTCYDLRKDLYQK